MVVRWWYGDGMVMVRWWYGDGTVSHDTYVSLSQSLPLLSSLFFLTLAQFYASVKEGCDTYLPCCSRCFFYAVICAWGTARRRRSASLVKEGRKQVGGVTR